MSGEKPEADPNAEIEKIVESITEITPEYWRDLENAGIDPEEFREKLEEIQDNLKDRLGLD